MPPRKTPQPPMEGQTDLFAGPEKSGPAPYSEAPFLPECSVKTEFGRLRVEDEIDFWGHPLSLVTMVISSEGRTYIRVIQGPGQQFALAPDSQVVWRIPREGE